MRTTLRRMRHLQQVVTDVVQRDLDRRRVRRHDVVLASKTGARRAWFDAGPRFGTRTLPARAVPPCSPGAYRRRVLDEVEHVLRSGGVPFLEDPQLGTAAALGIRDSEWEDALAALVHDELPVLLAASDGADPTALEFDPAPARGRLVAARVVHVLLPAVSDAAGRVVMRHGFESAVRLERWDRVEGGDLVPAVWNPRTSSLPSSAFTHPTDEEAADSLEALTTPALFEVTFPIDVVYTWVDGTDPAWLERKRTAVESMNAEQMTEDAAADLRFVDHDELRYSLRSLELYAPWVRHVYLVTDRQRPRWLRADHPRLTVVDHSEIAPPGAVLPTFNSHAIEANLHRIDGLSEHFLYLNDDVFLSSPVEPDLFFSPNGLAHMYLSRAQVAPGPPVDGEAASDSAGKNARRMVQEVCGRRLSRKLFHAPFALQRSVSAEIEDRWPDAVAETRRSQFRRIRDVTLSGALHMNYAYATARAVTRGLRYRYVNVGASDAASRLEGLLQDRQVLQTFCLNESDPELDAATIDRLVRGFLRRRFPDASTFEIPEVT